MVLTEPHSSLEDSTQPKGTRGECRIDSNYELPMDTQQFIFLLNCIGYIVRGKDSSKVLPIVTLSPAKGIRTA